MTTTTKKHIGRNISKIREIKGIKQETLAEILGISQQKVSQYENSEEIEDAKLEPIAKALGVTTEAIKNFSEDAVLNIISNTFNTNDNGIAILKTENYQPTFNPLDKVVELYERLLQAEKDKVTYLEKLVNK